MACPYCYNPHIVRDNGNISLDEALEFLQNRQGRLDSVVLSGGECTLYPHLLDFCETIKSLGYKIKLDTNGSHPEVLEKLLTCKAIDYVALDYKSPWKGYKTLTHYAHPKRIEHSLELLLRSDTPFEVRTTWHSDLLSVEDINTIIEDLHVKGYQSTYYLQHYLHVNETLGNTKEPLNIFDENQILKIIPIQFRN